MQIFVEPRSMTSEDNLNFFFKNTSLGNNLFPKNFSSIHLWFSRRKKFNFFCETQSAKILLQNELYEWFMINTYVNSLWFTWFKSLIPMPIGMIHHLYECTFINYEMIQSYILIHIFSHFGNKINFFKENFSNVELKWLRSFWWMAWTCLKT